MCAKMKSTLLCILVVLLLTALLGCAAAPKGAWVAADGYAPSGFPDELAFIDKDLCAVDGMSAMYKLKDGKLMFSAMGQIFTYKYDKPDKATMTLSDGGETVAYVPEGTKTSSAAFGAEAAPAVEAALAATAAPTEEPEPTPSPEELKQQAYDGEVAALRAKLTEYNAAGDAEGAMQYLTEQLKRLKITYPDVTADPELEPLRQSCAAAYKSDALSRADAAMTASGYQAALDILNAAVPYLDPEDKDIQKAIKYYKAFGPVYLADLDYFTREEDGFKLCTDSVQDNLGNEHEKVLGNSDGGGYNGPEFTSQTYVLDGRYTSFSGCCYLRFNARSHEKLQAKYLFYGDDQLLYETDSIAAGTMPIEFTLDITGVNLLRIELKAVQKGTMFGTIGATGFYQIGEALVQP